MRRQGINNHDIYYVEQNWFSPHILRINYAHNFVSLDMFYLYETFLVG